MSSVTWRNELQATLKLAWPLILAQLAQMALLTTDLIMMGWLGAPYLAAGQLANAFLSPLMLLGVCTLASTSALISQALGARQIKQVRRITRQGLWVSLGATTLLVPVIWQAGDIFTFFNQDPQLTALADSYLHYAVWSLYPAMMIVVLRCLVSAHGSTAIILMVTLSGVVLNALGNYALMFGHWGAPRLELVGAGITTTIVNAFMMLALLLYIFAHRRYRRYHILVRFWKPDWERFFQILRIGVPFGLMAMAEVGLFSAAAVLMGWLGTDELAAHAVALQCAGIAFMVPLGLSHATTIRVGLAYGRKDEVGIGRAGWVSILLGTGFMCFTALLFWLQPEPLIRAYLDPALEVNTEPFMFAISYLGIAALFQLVDGAQVMSGAALRGMNDTKIPMVIAVVGYWAVGLPVAYYCGFTLEMRGVGVWLGLAAGLAFVAAVLTARFALKREHLLRA